METAAASQPPSLLRQLRTATEQHQVALDDALNIARPALDLAAYRRLLERLYGLHAAWESHACVQFSTIMPGFYDRRRKVPLLEQDLLFLGMSVEQIAALPMCAELATSTGFAFTLGAAYVLEGSTLGGQILSRHFAESLGLKPDAGAAYLSGYREETGRMWREFIQMLESFAALTAVQNEIVTGAEKTFSTVHRWLVERHE